MHLYVLDKVQDYFTPVINFFEKIQRQFVIRKRRRHIHPLNKNSFPLIYSPFSFFFIKNTASSAIFIVFTKYFISDTFISNFSALSIFPLDQPVQKRVGPIFPETLVSRSNFAVFRRGRRF